MHHYTSKLNIAGVLSDVFGGEKLEVNNNKSKNIANLLEALVPESKKNSDNSRLLEKNDLEILDEEDDNDYLYEIKKQKNNRKTDIEM